MEIIFVKIVFYYIAGVDAAIGDMGAHVAQPSVGRPSLATGPAHSQPVALLVLHSLRRSDANSLKQ